MTPQWFLNHHLRSSWELVAEEQSITAARSARRPTMTASQRMTDLHTFISHHHLLLFQSSTHHWKAHHEIDTMAPLPQRASQTHHRPPTPLKNLALTTILIWNLKYFDLLFWNYFDTKPKVFWQILIKFWFETLQKILDDTYLTPIRQHVLVFRSFGGYYWQKSPNFPHFTQIGPVLSWFGQHRVKFDQNTRIWTSNLKYFNQFWKGPEPKLFWNQFWKIVVRAKMEGSEWGRPPDYSSENTSNPETGLVITVITIQL